MKTKTNEYEVLNQSFAEYGKNNDIVNTDVLKRKHNTRNNILIFAHSFIIAIIVLISSNFAHGIGAILVPCYAVLSSLFFLKYNAENKVTTLLKYPLSFIMLAFALHMNRFAIIEVFEYLVPTLFCMGVHNFFLDENKAFNLSEQLNIEEQEKIEQQLYEERLKYEQEQERQRLEKEAFEAEISQYAGQHDDCLSVFRAKSGYFTVFEITSKNGLLFDLSFLGLNPDRFDFNEGIFYSLRDNKNMPVTLFCYHKIDNSVEQITSKGRVWDIPDRYHNGVEAFITQYLKSPEMKNSTQYGYILLEKSIYDVNNIPSNISTPRLILRNLNISRLPSGINACEVEIINCPNIESINNMTVSNHITIKNCFRLKEISTLSCQSGSISDCPNIEAVSGINIQRYICVDGKNVGYNHEFEKLVKKRRKKAKAGNS